MRWQQNGFNLATLLLLLQKEREAIKPTRDEEMSGRRQAEQMGIPLSILEKNNRGEKIPIK